MTRYGIPTSVYLQKELLDLVNKALKENKYIYKSRNHLINIAIVRELRRIDTHGHENTQTSS